jgi:signal transduction histidine kinase
MEQIQMVVERVLDKARIIAERDRYQDDLRELNCALESEVERQTLDLRVQNQRLFAMNRVAHAISHSLELGVLLDRALAAAIDVVEAHAGIIYLLNPVTDYLYVAAIQGLEEDDLTSFKPLRLGQSIAGEVAQEGHVRTGDDLQTTNVLASGATVDLHTYVYVPLYTTGGVMLWDGESLDQPSIVGTLGIFTRRDAPFEPEEIEVLTTIGAQLGVAVTRAQYAADVRRANIELEAANVDLRRLDVLRSRFIQNVAHEIRTPLSLVRGYIELLYEGGLTEEQMSRALTVANQRIRELSNLVEDITTLQDLVDVPLKLKPVSLTVLLQTAYRMSLQRAVSQGIQLHYQEPEMLPNFLGDFERLVVAVHQLIDNACKFSEKGQSVVVSGGLSPDGRYVTFSVADEGIGIPRAEHERIFERFYQVDGGIRRRYGGMGLGLALVKEIVTAHGGWVRVESAPGKGSTFVIGLSCEVPAT